MSSPAVSCLFSQLSLSLAPNPQPSSSPGTYSLFPGDLRCLRPPHSLPLSILQSHFPSCCFGFYVSLFSLFMRSQGVSDQERWLLLGFAQCSGQCGMCGPRRAGLIHGGGQVLRARDVHRRCGVGTWRGCPSQQTPPLDAGLAPTPHGMGFLQEDMPAASRSVLLCSLIFCPLCVIVPNKIEWFFYYLMLSKIKGSNHFCSY